MDGQEPHNLVSGTNEWEDGRIQSVYELLLPFCNNGACQMDGLDRIPARFLRALVLGLAQARGTIVWVASPLDDGDWLIDVSIGGGLAYLGANIEGAESGLLLNPGKLSDWPDHPERDAALTHTLRTKGTSRWEAFDGGRRWLSESVYSDGSVLVLTFDITGADSTARLKVAASIDRARRTLYGD